MKVQTHAEQIFFSTSRIQTDCSVGTGLFFGHEWGKDGTALFLVTNKHVIAGAKSGSFFLVESKNKEPVYGVRHQIDVPDFEKQWFGHPDPDVDVAVLPLTASLLSIQGKGFDLFYRAITRSQIPSPDQLEELNPIEEVVFIGYPSGMYDTVNLLPIARRGVTASPASVDYCGKPQFMIDASVFPGSSGSPVFVCNSGPRATRDGKLAFGNRFFFLGLISSVALREDRGFIEFQEAPTSIRPVIKTQQMIDLGIVVKSRTVLETVVAYLRAKGAPADELEASIK